MKVEEQDALGLRQLSPKLISTRVITKYGELHYSMLIRVVESCTMALIQHIYKLTLVEFSQIWLCVPQETLIMLVYCRLPMVAHVVSPASSSA